MYIANRCESVFYLILRLIQANQTAKTAIHYILVICQFEFRFFMVSSMTLVVVWALNERLLRKFSQLIKPYERNQFFK